MKTLKDEHAAMLGNTQGRAYAVIADDSGRICNQVIKFTRHYEKSGVKYRLTVNLRFDDQCNNGHEDFSITGDQYRFERGAYREDSFGCLHNDIAEVFPELVHLIKWHLTNIDGPMYYISNTTFLAGNRDCWGKLKGEPKSYGHGIKFGNSPITHNLSNTLYKFLQDNPCAEFVEVPHKNEKTGYQFGPKYAPLGYTDVWHKCPWDTQQEAEEFIQAYALGHEFVTFPTSFGEGKDRKLDAARSAAVWPEATDEQLSLPEEELEKLLLARLPALIEAFKADMLAIGFVWPSAESNRKAA